MKFVYPLQKLYSYLLFIPIHEIIKKEYSDNMLNTIRYLILEIRFPVLVISNLKKIYFFGRYILSSKARIMIVKIIAFNNNNVHHTFYACCCAANYIVPLMFCVCATCYSTLYKIQRNNCVNVTEQKNSLYITRILTPTKHTYYHVILEHPVLVLS